MRSRGAYPRGMIPARCAAMRMRCLLVVPLLAACRDGSVTVEGGFAADALAPTAVVVLESERQEPVGDRFRLDELTPGPISLRFLESTDTTAVLNLAGLPRGSRLVLHDLAPDEDSRFLFPRAVELSGADVVTVNGLRFAPEGRVPREVDAAGTLLARSEDGVALLVRPDDARLPDLRVVSGAGTEVVGSGGESLEMTDVGPGDSLRVEGRSEGGYVIASRITLPTGLTTPETPAEEPEPEPTADAPASQPASSDAGRAAEPAPSSPSGSTDRPGRGRGGNGRGKAKGRN